MWWAHLSTIKHRPLQWAVTTISHLSLTTILAGSHSVLIHGPTRRGGIPKSAQTHNHLESFSSTPSKSQHRCSQQLRSSQNHSTMKLDWGRALKRNTPIIPKVFAQTLRSCPFWDHFHFSLLWSELLRKKKIPMYTLYIWRPHSMCKSIIFRRVHTHTQHTPHID